MPNPLLILVEDPDQLLSAGEYGAGAVVRLQTSATEAGVFADVSGVGSTPTIPIVTLVEIYAGVDPNGTSSSWYRTRYENVGATRVSDWTTAFQVGVDGSGLICSLHDVKRRLKIAAVDTGEDALLIEFIIQVTADLQTVTGRQFVRTPASGTTTYLEDVTCSGRRIRVNKGIAEMSTLEVATSSQPATGGTYTTVPSTDWFLRPQVQQRDFGWPATEIVVSDVSPSMFYYGYNTVRWTGAVGWAAVPADIRGMAERCVVRNYQAKQSGQADVIGTSEFGSRILRFLSPEEQTRLTWYSALEIG